MLELPHEVLVELLGRFVNKGCGDNDAATLTLVCRRFRGAVLEMCTRLIDSCYAPDHSLSCEVRLHIATSKDTVLFSVVAYSPEHYVTKAATALKRYPWLKRVR